MKTILKTTGVIALCIVFYFIGALHTTWRAREAIFFYNEYQKKEAYPTGYEVLEELNRYRVTSGMKEFELYQPLCNNIATRWINYKEGRGHEGLFDFQREYMPDLEISEILVTAPTAEAMVQGWASSPSHDLFIKENSKICVYSAEGYAVALLSK